MTKETNIFRTANGAKFIESQYSDYLDKSELTIKEHYIPTRFGNTFILEGENITGKPLVLLHGSGENSTMWFKYWPELLKTYHLYAIDIIGEPGRSLLDFKLSEVSQYAEWLCEVFDSLQLRQSYIAGVSFGATLALLMAYWAPEKVRQVAALVPVGVISSMSIKTLWKILILQFTYSRKKQTSLFRYLNGKSLPVLEEQQLTDTAVENHLHNNRSVILPAFKFKTRQLQEFQVPCRCYLAELDPLYNAAAVKKELDRINGKIKVEVVRNQGHFLDFNLLPYLHFND